MIIKKKRFNICIMDVFYAAGRGAGNFAFLPFTIENETRWLEMVYYERADTRYSDWFNDYTPLRGTHIWSGIEVGKVDDEDDYNAGLCFKFTLDGITYLAIEDEDDGYRSFMRELQVSSESCNTPLPDILVWCEYEDENERDILKIYEVASGNLILVLGQLI